MSNPSTSSSPISVMLVDDSAVIRGLLTRLLESDPEIKVVNAVANGQQAIDTIAKHQPDITILDIEMPVMDGLTALPKIIQACPLTRVVMCSTLTLRNADVTLKALSMGAMDTIAKPTTAGGIVSGDEFKANLINIVRQLGRAPVKRIINSMAPTAPAGKQPSTLYANKTWSLRDLNTATPGRPAIVAIGSSTGGPEALFTVLKSFKGFNVPIIVTQHMPATFTTMLAKHIESNTGITTVEGQDGMLLEPGQIYLAPGGFHMVLEKPEGAETLIRINSEPPENFCRPAVDPMFRSAVNIYKSRVLGVILTGMGQDGLEGGRKLVEAGGRLIAQDEATSVVWGMPGAVATASLCHKVLPLAEIGPWVRNAVMGP